MLSLKRILLIACALCSLNVRAENHSLESAALENILKTAASNAPAMIESQISIARTNADRLRGWVTYLPEIRMNYRLGGYHEIRKSIKPEDATRIGASESMTASHPVYHWGAIDARRQQGFAMEASSIAQAWIDYARLIIRLRGKYYDLVAQKSRMAQMELRTDFKRQELDKQNLLVSQGRASPNQRDQIALDLNALELEHTYSMNQLENNLVLFRNEAGYLDLTTKDLPNDLLIPEVDVDALEAAYQEFTQRDFALSAPSELAESNRQAVESELVINRARQKPTLNFEGGVSLQPVEVENAYELQTIFFIGLGGSWNLFDRDETRSNTRSLLLRKRQIEARLASTKAELFAQARNALDLLKMSELSLELRQRQKALAEEALDVSTREHQKGQGSLEQVQQDTLRLAQARADLLADKVKWLNAYYTFLGSLFKDPALGNLNDVLLEAS